ncbi:hypothetical protein P171DRAFT_449249 [Karstenula rhodostoma CBS 690.94]|uniref:Uncharacterized protein n=1 Tax=Karstenula rhodostoma CBS 690.94 TaxID=1392251 RepID=A0A9P4P7A5_9PLEO|nr:hypothetical protein P171DRAFT_449249 [Karstenula rhodostoma CBS 690.94]
MPLGAPPTQELPNAAPWTPRSPRASQRIGGLVAATVQQCNSAAAVDAARSHGAAQRSVGCGRGMLRALLSEIGGSRSHHRPTSVALAWLSAPRAVQAVNSPPPRERPAAPSSLSPCCPCRRVFASDPGACPSNTPPTQLLHRRTSHAAGAPLQLRPFVPTSTSDQPSTRAFKRRASRLSTHSPSESVRYLSNYRSIQSPVCPSSPLLLSIQALSEKTLSAMSLSATFSQPKPCRPASPAHLNRSFR